MATSKKAIILQNLSKEFYNMNNEIDYIKRFHGQIDPYIILGYKMGIYALELLNCDLYWDMKISAKIGVKPPITLILDGLQLSTGCTFGKGNIINEKLCENEACFYFKNNICKIKIKTNILQEIENSTDKENLAKKYFKLEPSNFFEMKLSLAKLQLLF